MIVRYALAILVASAGLLSGCASSPYLNSPWWLSAENSPVWTAEQRLQFFESITPGETTLGDVVEMYGPSMSAPSEASGGQVTATMYWYGETGLNQPWAAIDVPGRYTAWNDNSPVLAVYTSEGLKKTRSAEPEQQNRLRQSTTGPAKKPPPTSEQTSRNPEPANQTELTPFVAGVLADGVIGPNEIVDEVAAAMAAYGESGGTISGFRSRFGPEAQYSEDVRFFRTIQSTLYYGSKYGGGPSIWVDFDGDDQYESTMIHIPRGGNKAPDERYF